MAKGVGYPVDTIVYDETIYTSSTMDLYRVLHSIDNTHSTAFFIGHNYAITDLAEELISQQLVNIPTSGIVSMDCAISSWKEIGPGCGTLLFFDYPKMYGELRWIRSILTSRVFVPFTTYPHAKCTLSQPQHLETIPPWTHLGLLWAELLSLLVLLKLKIFLLTLNSQLIKPQWERVALFWVSAVKPPGMPIKRSWVKNQITPPLEKYFSLTRFLPY